MQIVVKQSIIYESFYNISYDGINKWFNGCVCSDHNNDNNMEILCGMKKYYSIRNDFFEKNPRLFEIYRRYYNDNDHESVLGRIGTYYFLLKIILLSKFNPNKLNSIKRYNPDIYYLECEHFGDLNDDKVLYLIERDEEGAGFTSILRIIMYALVFAEKFNMTPVITISENCNYYQPEGYNGKFNPFEYYYVQPSGISKEEALNSDRVIRFKIHHLNILKEFSWEDLYLHSESFVCYFADLYKKYFILRDEIKNKIYNDFEKMGLDERTLGIHFRGGDFSRNYNRHPKMVIIEDYYDYIDTALEHADYNKIFVATDDNNALQCLLDVYGDKIIYYEDVLRTNNDKSVIFAETERNNNQFLLGYEVLRDMYTLSFCNGIISGISMVAVFARIIKKSLDKDYEYDQYIDLGLNENPKDYKDDYMKMRKKEL